MLLCILIVGTAGYKLIGGASWTLLDAAYMTIITLSSVGYGEVHNLEKNVPARIFTIFLIFFGAGVLLFVLSSTTAFIVEGELSNVLWRNKMRKEIERLHGHYLVCGGGRNGRAVIEELLQTGHDTVVIERDPGIIEHVREALPEALIVVGDATDDEVLLEAGVKRAAGLITALPEDKDNLFITITARGLNPKLRIVAKCVDPHSRRKLLSAGADAIVSPYTIAGLRMASEMVRPTVVTFLDTMLRRPTGTYRIEEVQLTASSSLLGQSLSDAGIPTKTGLQVLAVRDPGEAHFTYNPPSTLELREGQVLVVLGERAGVEKLRRLAV